MGTLFSTGVQEALHLVAQVLKVPVMLLLLVMIIYALYQLGSLIAEHLTEHRHLNVSIPQFMDEIAVCPSNSLSETVERSGLLARQRGALQVLLAHGQLPLDDLLALSQKLLFSEESHYERIVGRTDLLAKIAPMVGLMGTLIPLGPGIVALGNGDIETLSNALLIAFDTTTAGLVVAAFALVVSKIRIRWYAEYGMMLESAMTAVLKRMRELAAAGPGEVDAMVRAARPYAAPFDAADAQAAKGGNAQAVSPRRVDAGAAARG